MLDDGDSSTTTRCDRDGGAARVHEIHTWAGIYLVELITCLHPGLLPGCQPLFCTRAAGLVGWGGVTPHTGVRKLVGWVPIGRTPMHVHVH